MLTAACLSASVLLVAVPVHAEPRDRRVAAATSTVTVRIVDATGTEVGVPRSFDHDALDDVVGPDVAHGYYEEQTAAGPKLTLDNIRGVSILRMLAFRGAVASHVTRVEIPQTGRETIELRADRGDLSTPGTPGYPYANGMPPLFSPDCCTGDVYAVVNYRSIPTGTGGFADDGGYLTASNGDDLTATVYLDGSLLFPVVQDPPATVKAGTPFTVGAGLTGAGDPARFAWTWDFGDGVPDPSRAPTTTHTFAAPGTYTVQAAAEGTGSDRSSGLSAPVTIQVTPAVASPPPSTPPPAPSPSVQPSLGNGAPSGANGGPVSGDGSRVGGLATSRSGGGPPGPSSDRRSSAAAASGAAPSATAGELVGRLLAGPDTPFAQPSQAAARPLDDTAPAARSGVGPGLLGWTAGALVVVVLLVLGAGAERRRPHHVRRTRLPTRRAR